VQRLHQNKCCKLVQSSANWRNSSFDPGFSNVAVPDQAVEKTQAAPREGTRPTGFGQESAAL